MRLHLSILALLLAACADRPAREAPPQAASAMAVAKPTAPRPQPLAVRELHADSLPAGVRHRGVVVARRWTDRLGDNLLVITVADSGESCDQHGTCGRDGEMFAYHYLLGGDPPTVLWRTTDFLRACDLDLTFRVDPRTVTVTDLDADGTAETSYMYIMACRGGVDPALLKLIMHEGAAKYAIRGTTEWRDMAGMPPSEMNLDPAFTAAPRPFRDFAVAQWRKYQEESGWHAGRMGG